MNARTQRYARLVQRYESRNVTATGDGPPIFWQDAAGVWVSDTEGRRYLDFTAAFGVANLGHSNDAVRSAVAQQARTLMHGMGDLYPTAIRACLLEALAAVAAPLGKSYLCANGSDAVEAALKTAALFSGKSRVAAFAGGYHGLSYGALEVCGIERFRAPFLDQLRDDTIFFDFPRDEHENAHTLRAIAEHLSRCDEVGACIVEPVQGRAGIIVPPGGFLPGLRALCDQYGVVLIVDEILTGFGRTGEMFTSLAQQVVPDILCVGKALANGFPISAAIGKAEVMDAWPASRGEALLTSTHLGNPMGCAAALAALRELKARALPTRAAHLGARFELRLRALTEVSACVRAVRGRGLMWGIELDGASTAQRVVARALERGLFVLQSGTDGNVLSLTPPLVISETELALGFEILASALARERAA